MEQWFGPTQKGSGYMMTIEGNYWARCSCGWSVKDVHARTLADSHMREHKVR